MLTRKLVDTARAALAVGCAAGLAVAPIVGATAAAPSEPCRFVLGVVTHILKKAP